MTTPPIENQDDDDRDNNDGDHNSDKDVDVSDWEQLYEQDQLEDAVLIVDSHFNEDGYIAHFYPFPRH